MHEFFSTCSQCVSSSSPLPRSSQEFVKKNDAIQNRILTLWNCPVANNNKKETTKHKSQIGNALTKVKEICFLVIGMASNRHFYAFPMLISMLVLCICNVDWTTLMPQLITVGMIIYFEYAWGPVKSLSPGEVQL